MKTKILFLVMLIIPIFLAACLPFFEKTIVNSDDSKPIDWWTYSNSKYSFKVNLPSDWQVIELPVPEFPNVNNQVWFVNKASPEPNTDSRADIVLVFTKVNPASIWEQQYFDDYKVNDLWLGEILAKKVTGINKESKYPEIVVLAELGDYYLQAIPNQGDISLEYFEPIISSLRYENSNKSDSNSITIRDKKYSNNQLTDFDGISFEYPFSLLGKSNGQKFQAYIDPAGFIYNDVPNHIRFDFLEPYTSQEPFIDLQTTRMPWLQHQNNTNSLTSPQIFVFPTKEYTDTNSLAEERIKALSNIIAENNLDTLDEFPVLPTFNSAQDFHSRAHVISFQNGSGVSFLTRYSQGISPVSNPNVFYTFQGLTADGKHYVAAFFPLYVSQLLDEVQIENLDAFSKNYKNYIIEISAELDNLSSKEFTPDLEILDSIIQSIAISNDQHESKPESNALKDNLVSPSETKCFVTNFSPLTFTPDGERVVFKAENGVQILNLKTLIEEKFIKVPEPNYITATALSPDGKYLAWALDNHNIQLINISENKVLNTLIGHKGIVGKLLFSPDGTRLFSASHDTWFKEWDLKGNLINAFQPTGALGLPTEVLGIGISPDGSMLATIPFDGPVKLWWTGNFRLIRVLGAYGGFDTSDISFSPDGKLISVDTATGLFLWETSTGRTLIQGNPGINTMATIFSPDGRFLAYGEIGEKNKVVVSTPDGAQKIRILDGLVGPTGILFFSPDSSLLLASDWVETRIWRVDDGQLMFIGKSSCP